MKKRINCSNCASVAHVEAWCVYAKRAKSKDTAKKDVRRRLTDRQKDALYRRFFAVGGNGVDLIPGSPKQDELTDRHFQQMAELMNGVSLLAGMAMRDYFDEVGQQITAYVQRVKK